MTVTDPLVKLLILTRGTVLIGDRIHVAAWRHYYYDEEQYIGYEVLIVNVEAE